MALCGIPARSDALAVAPRALRACACGAVRIFVAVAWQAAGIGRVGGVPRVCRGALPWGLGSGRVAHVHDITRCDLRFAWQVWDFGCIDALGKALDGGSAWQAQ